jgi:hypothetical protein
MKVTGVQNNTAFYGKKTKEPLYVVPTIAACVGATAISSTAPVPVGLGVIKLMQKIGNMPEETIKTIHRAINKALVDTGLNAKGTFIQRVPEVAPKNILEKLTGLKDPAIGAKHGTNAGFGKAYSLLNPKVKTIIVVPEKKIAFAGFHEIGHAMNYNFSKVGKLLQKLRGPGVLAAMAIAAFGCFTKNTKAQEGQELTKGQKIKNGIRNNAGKLAFAAMVPMLAEEAMATIKGQKIASKLLDKNLAKTVLKGNGVAYLTYASMAAGVALAAWAGVKIKDKLIARKEAKSQIS